MTAVSKMARVTVRGKDTPLEDDTPQYRAWLVYTSIREEAERRNMDRLAAKDGTPGWKYVGSVNRHLTSLFPEYDQTSDPEQRQAFQRPVYAYLSATHNAECLVRGGGQAKPVWWVRDTWRDSGGDAGAGTPHRDEAPMTPEATEVVSTWKCKECDATFPTRQALAGHTSQRHPVSVAAKPCGHCGQPFDSPLLLAQHVAREHPTMWTCPTCKKVLDARGRAGHARSHVGKYPCEVCGKVFDSPRSRNSHKVVHSGKPDATVGTRDVTVLNVPLAAVPTPAPTVAPLDLGAALTSLVQQEVEKRLEAYAREHDDLRRRAEEAEARLAEMRKLLGV